ncbi:MAG: penicillin-binding protein [Lachnospiraceae bacterium]|nr:penicillin-binding protein [Lachnospiraceae bacterium]
MFSDIKDFILSVVKSRLFVLVIVFIVLFSVLIQRLFTLQIVKGEEYLDKYVIKTEKKQTISSTRGNIYDRNGKLLAYDELAYSVTIEDTYEGKDKDKKLNNTIRSLVKIIEEKGDSIINDFNIIVGESGKYEYTVEDTARLRFIADVYGYAKIDKLEEDEKNSTAEQLMAYMAERYGIGEYQNNDKEKPFIIDSSYSKEELLKVVTVRYQLSLNLYQQFVATVVANDVKEETVAVIMENSDTLQGVGIAENTMRKYVDSIYMAQIIGYTGKVSAEELEEYQKIDDSYSLTDMVGKSGIEQEMETQLQGKKGYKLVAVDNMGKVVEELEQEEPVAGNDLYLTIDIELQKAVYNIIEQKLAGILHSKIIDSKTYHQTGAAKDIKIPIDDVYYALINNNVIKTSHFQEDDAGPTEKQVLTKYESRRDQAIAQILAELKSDNPTPYKSLSEEMQVYETFITTLLGKYNNGVIKESEINTSHEAYKEWKNETIGLKTYLQFLIEENCIDISKLSVESRYSDSDEIYSALLSYLEEKLKDGVSIRDSQGNASSFTKKVFKYMIVDNQISGKELCYILYEQGVLPADDEDKEKLYNGAIGAYQFMRTKIEKIDITPAQLALDPCSASCIVTDVNTGEALAVVSYPSYDNNLLANTVDSEYYNSLLNDLSRPLYNNATQQQTAPGSTFKPISAIAGLEEQVISTGSYATCTGIFDKTDIPIKCWIYSGSHGSLNVVGGLENSCNYFFNDVAYKLSQNNGKFDSQYGLTRLEKYAKMFGLGDVSGLEIVETKPQISNQDPLRSAIGQGTHNYTISQLSRYVTTLANKGTCYNLSLLDKVTTSDGTVVEDFTPTVYNQVEMADSTWQAVKAGMIAAAADYNSLKEIEDMLTVAGKTGTAEQNKNRANHALFIGYAPADAPEISVAARITYGYTSANAVEIARDVYKYYFKLEDTDDILSGTAEAPDGQTIGD